MVPLKHGNGISKGTALSRDTISAVFSLGDSQFCCGICPVGDGDPIPIGCRLHSRQLSDLCMNPKVFLMAVDIYRANGGKSACSPNQSCEGETPGTVILKDFDGHPVTGISLPEKSLLSISSGSTPSHGHGDQISGMVSSSKSLAGNFCHAVAVFTLIGGLGSALAAMDDYDPDYAGIYFGLGAAASSAPIFAIGSIANSTRRSAKIIEWMAEQENRRRAATPDA